jgi:hypothetical protein
MANHSPVRSQSKNVLGRNYSRYYNNRTILKKQVSFQKNFTVCPVGVKGRKAHIIGDGWRTKHLKMKKKHREDVE